MSLYLLLLVVAGAAHDRGPVVAVLRCRALPLFDLKNKNENVAFSRTVVPVPSECISPSDKLKIISKI